MKPYQDYKKLFNILIILTILIVPVGFSLAQTAAEIQNIISGKDADIKKLEKEIASYQAQLDNIGQQKNSLSNSIKGLDLTTKKLNADIAVTQNKIDKTTLKIQNLSRDIGTKEVSITNNTEAISLSIKEINEYENGSMLSKILSSDDFSVAWNDIDNAITIQESLRNNTTELKQVKGELEDTRKVTIDAKNELLSLKSELADQKKIVVQNTNEKKKLLEQTKNDEANYQKILQNRLAQKDALEKELRDYESQLKYILDPSKLPKAGVFSWPLDSVLITSPFGPRWGSFHYGVDFRAAVGTPVRAMANGVVSGTGDTDLQCPGASFGRFTLIKYDNGLSSAYGHLSLIKVSKGQKVTRGQIVAYSGNTGYSTGPHLHVSVYAPDAAEIKSLPSKSCPGKVLTQPVAPTNAYLDPTYYLPSSH